MPGLSPSVDICGSIVQWASRGDLSALCLTCKAFQREAEARLYDSLVFTDPQRAYQACRTLITEQRHGPLVHSFCYNHEIRRSSPPHGSAFWSAIQGAFHVMHNLEFVSITDTHFNNGWIFDPTKIKFQLKEAKLRFAWDAHLVRFFETQHKLRSLQIFDNLDDAARVDIDTSLMPDLHVFDGTLMMAMQFVSCPLSHLQITLDVDVAPILLHVLPRLINVHATLRGLSLLDIPEELSDNALGIIVQSCPNLHHIGLLPFPLHNRPKFYQSLMQLHHLRSIELDVTRWQPHPIPAAQRALAAEIRVYRPTIRFIAFWLGSTRFRWVLGDDWHSRVDTHQYPQYSNVWSTA